MVAPDLSREFAPAVRGPGHREWDAHLASIEHLPTCPFCLGKDILGTRDSETFVKEASFSNPTDETDVTPL
jgi:hypothetical protein